MGTAAKVKVSDRQRAILEKWVRHKADSPYRLVERCRIIQMSAEGVSNSEQARRLDVDRQRPRRWRRRWVEAEERLAEAEREGVTDRDLGELLEEVLSDEQRPGIAPKFSAEQLTQIIAVACERPEECGRPVTHWTPRELADELKKRGVVSSISPRHVDRVLKGGISVRTRPGTG